MFKCRTLIVLTNWFARIISDSGKL